MNSLLNSSFHTGDIFTDLLAANIIAIASTIQEYFWKLSSCKHKSTKNSQYFLTYLTFLSVGDFGLDGNLLDSTQSSEYIIPWFKNKVTKSAGVENIRDQFICIRIFLS